MREICTSGSVGAPGRQRPGATRPLYAAIGGFHLFDATDETLEWTARQLLPMRLAYFIGAHCTGVEAV